jgi:serine/threonine-protein kinase RsbW
VQPDSNIPLDSLPFQNMLEWSTTSDTANLAESRKRIEQFATEQHFKPEHICALGLSVNEAMANIIRHAYSGEPQKPITITVELAFLSSSETSDTDKVIRISMRDWGTGQHPVRKQPAETRDPLEPGGLGLICLHKLMDQVSYVPQADGMLLRLIKRNS